MSQDDKPRTSVAKLLDGRRRQVMALSAASLAGGLSEAVFLVVITRAAFAITNGKETIGVLAGRSLSVGGLVWLAFSLVVVRVLLALASAWQAARLSAGVVAAMRCDLAHAYLQSSWSVQQEQRSGRLQEVLTTFVGNGATLVSAITSGIISVFNLIALLGLAILVDPVGSLVVVVAVVMLGSLLSPIRARVRRRAEEAALASMEFATSLSEVSQMGMEVHVFNVQPQTEAGVTTLIEKNAAMGERLGFLRGVVPALYSGFAYLALVGAIGLVAASNTTSFTSLGAVMLVMLRSLSYGQALQSSVTTISATMPFVEALGDELEAYRDAAVVDHGQPVDKVGTLTLQAVSFHYIEGQPVLTEVDASIPSRQVIGIVGPSGSGKSTLVQLMLGLRTPTSGRVMADDRDIHVLSRADWARRVTFVPQAAHLVAGTVADNIRFLRDDVTDTDIERASRLAHLHEDVSAWPEGYQRDVGSAGGHLSGGQQQRLCIARALVENPDVLILDEPTSSLDVRSESLIRETLSELAKKMTVIVIAHRMSTLEICDRIMVIQDGQLKAFDTPENLEKGNAFYRDALALSGLR